MRNIFYLGKYILKHNNIAQLYFTSGRVKLCLTFCTSLRDGSDIQPSSGMVLIFTDLPTGSGSQPCAMLKSVKIEGIPK